MCIDLEPSSFEPWYTYMCSTFAMENIKAGLIAMDCAPLFPEPNFLTIPEACPNYDISLPYIHRSTDIHQYLMLPNFKVLDYRIFKKLPGVSVFDYNVYGQLPSCYTDDLSEAELSILKPLMASTRDRLIWNSCETRCFELLVSLEKEHGFEMIYKVKQELYFTKIENQYGMFLEPLPI